MKRWLPGYVTQVSRRRRVLAMPPPMVLTLGFFGLILFGTVLLKLPAATHHPIGWMEALFTSTSAVTVTGLTVLDIGTVFTRFGEVVLLGLIQIGGLGFMSFAVLVMTLLGQRLSLRHQVLLRDDLNQTSLGDLMRLVRIIIVVVLIFEGLGTFLLTVSQHLPFLDLAFEATSAFGTAGLTRGVTGQLDGFGELVVMLLMFIGRVGPLSLGFLLATPHPNRYRYPQERIYLG